MIGSHIEQPGGPDQIAFGCPQGKTCFKHTPVSYKKAREYLFGAIHLKGNSAKNYALQIYYCEDLLTSEDFAKGDGPAPMNIPDPLIVNAEHTWPQSKFTSGYSKETQKADIHILLPILSRVNSVRGNHPYGEVVTPTSVPCEQSALGKSAQGTTVFEPSDDSKGNVARAVFYYSIRYKTKIDPEQEGYLKKWHKMDPPDSDEIERNEMVFEVQKDRNPFIDAPELVDSIDDF